MHREDGSVCEDNVFSVAPGEEQNLLVFLQMNTSRCATTQSICVELWPMANREKRLTVRKYFNQGFLDADGRFARDVECLLTAVESKQVSEDASIVL